MKAGIYRTPNGNLIYVAKDRTIKATTLSPSSWPGTKVKTEADGARVVIDVGGSDYVCHRASDVPNGCTDPQAELIRVQMRLYPEPEVVQEDIYAGVRTKIYDSEQALPRATSMPATLGMGYGKDLERGTSHGKMSGGPLSSNLPRVDVSDRTEEKMARLAAASKSGVPEAWRNVENAGQYKDLQFEMERVAMQAKGFRLCHAQSARKHRRQGDTVLPSDTRPGAHWWRYASTQRTVKINVRGHVFDTPAAI